MEKRLSLAGLVVASWMFLAASLASAQIGPPGGGTSGGTTGGTTTGGSSGGVQYLKYVPVNGTTLFPIRRGESDDLSVDRITPIDIYGNAICLEKGGEFKVQLYDTRPEFNIWQVHSARLYSAVTNETYWEWTTPSDYMSENEVWPPEPIQVPDFIEYAKFDIVYIATIGPDPPEGGGGGPVTMGSNEVFVVYNEPTRYQQEAWANILRWSCTAARTKDNPYFAEIELTYALYEQFTYDWSRAWWTATTGAEEEIFWAREFLEEKKGQCNDFADFLCASMHSLGFVIPDATRTYPLSIAFDETSNPDGWAFATNEFDPAGPVGPTTTAFAYHQFVLVPSVVYDGAIAYEALPDLWLPPAGTNLSTYETIIVNVYFHDLDMDGLIERNEIVPVGGPGSPWNPVTVQLTLLADDKPGQ